MVKRINIVLFGIGKTGSALINKVVKNRKELAIESHIDLRFPVITNSTVAFFEKEGANFAWEANFIQFGVPFRLEYVLEYVSRNELDNLIAVDATASAVLPGEYLTLVKHGFSIVTLNEALAALPGFFENGIRHEAEKRGAGFTNVSMPGNNRQAAVNAVYDAILDIAAKKKEVA